MTRVAGSDVFMQIILPEDRKYFCVSVLLAQLAGDGDIGRGGRVRGFKCSGVGKPV